MDKLVSLISPCFNGERYIKPFLDSVLKQSYHNIELIFVNDGSTDNTEAIIESYEPRFKDHNIKLIYLKQENKGAAAAINKGLKLFSGEYIMWPDSDDILLPNHISTKVQFLESNREYGFVQCTGFAVYEQNYNKKKKLGRKENPAQVQKDFFEDLLFGNNVVFCPCTYMARSEILKKAIPNLSIYESKEGQNWQLLLPLAWTSECGYITTPLYYYVERKQSHSHMKRNYDSQIQRIKELVRIREKTLHSIPLPTSYRDSLIAEIRKRAIFEKKRCAFFNLKLKDYRMYSAEQF